MAEVTLDRIRALELTLYERLNTYLGGLDAAGWVEQSYCSDWLVYSVVSHLGSGARITGGRLNAWLTDSPPLSQDEMRKIWAHFDALKPEQMLGEFRAAYADYLPVLKGAPAEAGNKQVEGFFGPRPLSVYQAARIQELSLHAWDVYVARDPKATLDSAAVELRLDMTGQAPMRTDPAKLGGLQGKKVQFDLRQPERQIAIDFSGERPAMSQGAVPGAEVRVAGPAEEVVRLLTGRHFVPGSRPQLTLEAGSSEDWNTLRHLF